MMSLAVKDCEAIRDFVKVRIVFDEPKEDSSEA